MAGATLHTAYRLQPSTCQLPHPNHPSHVCPFTRPQHASVPPPDGSWPKIAFTFNVEPWSPHSVLVWARARHGHFRSLCLSSRLRFGACAWGGSCSHARCRCQIACDLNSYCNILSVYSVVYLVPHDSTRNATTLYSLIPRHTI